MNGLLADVLRSCRDTKTTDSALRCERGQHVVITATIACVSFMQRCSSTLTTHDFPCFSVSVTEDMEFEQGLKMQKEVTTNKH